MDAYKIITYSPWMWPLLFLPRLFHLMMISTVDTHTTLIATPTTVAAVVAAAIVVLSIPGVVDTTAVLVVLVVLVHDVVAMIGQ